jgi:hypothetical protein
MDPGPTDRFAYDKAILTNTTASEGGDLLGAK